MSKLDQILASKPGWYKAFNAIPITGNCDSKCGRPATQWFGNTNCATCGSEECIAIQMVEYNSNTSRDPDDE